MYCAPFFSTSFTIRLLVFYGETFFVFKGSANQHDKIDYGPDSEAAECDNHEDACAYFPGVKTVNAQAT